MLQHFVLDVIQMTVAEKSVVLIRIALRTMCLV